MVTILVIVKLQYSRKLKPHLFSKDVAKFFVYCFRVWAAHLEMALEILIQAFVRVKFSQEFDQIIVSNEYWSDHDSSGVTASPGCSGLPLPGEQEQEQQEV